ncbi:MAG: ThuA domain-containing protein [Terracidiphilus sp.]
MTKVGQLQNLAKLRGLAVRASARPRCLTMPGCRVRLALLVAAIGLLALRSNRQGPGKQAPRPSGQEANGVHIYIWSGLKSHLAGQHDYPQFLADWSKILTDHGAVVDGALHAPSAVDLEHADVVVIYKGDAGYLGDEEKAALEAFVKRGGGLVSLHDSLCGPDPAYFAALVGGAKKHGEVNYTLGAPIAYTVVDSADPIMKGMSNFTIFDEAFYKMTWAQDPRHPRSGHDGHSRHAERRLAQGRGSSADLDL